MGYIDVFSSRYSFLGELRTYEEMNRNITRCMSGQGHDYIPVVREFIGTEEYYTDLTNTDLPEADFAARWGFGMSTVQNTGSWAMGGEPEEGLSESYYDVLYGADGVSGCWGDAAGLHARTAEMARKGSDSIPAVKRMFAEDQRVVDYYTDWSQCMQVKGHETSSPLMTFLDVEQSLRKEAVSQDGPDFGELATLEKEAAVDTVQCGGSVHDFLPVELEPVWEEYAEELHRRIANTL